MPRKTTLNSASANVTHNSSSTPESTRNRRRRREKSHQVPQRHRIPQSTCRFDVANLLPEILDQIFGEVEDEGRRAADVQSIPEDHLSIETTPSDADCVIKEGYILIGPPKFNMLSFMLVCKGWWPIAERRMYQSISIGTSTRRKSQASLLLRTLEEKPGLAGWVRELRMLEPSAIRGPDQHLAHAGIISACTQLSHLTLLGFATSKKVLNTLRCSISGLTGLRTLVLVQHITWHEFDGSHFGLCSSAELLRWMSQWSDIQHVVVLANKKLPTTWGAHRDYVPRSRKAHSKMPVAGTPALNSARASGSSQQLLSLPHLRTFTFFRHAITETSLRLLSAAASSLTSLCIDIQSAMTAALCDSLIIWAPTLQILSLQCSTQQALDINSIEGVLSRLSNLRYLRTTSSVVSPRALPPLSALEALDYDVEDPLLMETLVEVVPGKLQALRTCRLLRVATARFGPEVMVALEVIEAACKERGIMFTSYINWQEILNALGDEDEDEDEDEEPWGLDDYDEWEDGAGGYSPSDYDGGISYWDDGWGQTHITFEHDGELLHTSYRWDDDEDYDVARLVSALRRSL